MSNLTPNNGWISVRDRLPDTDRYVIIRLETGDMCYGWCVPNLQIGCL